MTRFELEGGGWTVVQIFRNEKGEVFAFPSANADIVQERGTPEAKEHLKELIKLYKGGQK